VRADGAVMSVSTLARVRAGHKLRSLSDLSDLER